MTSTSFPTETSTVFDDTQVCTYCGTASWMAINICTATVAVVGNSLTISAILLSKKLSSIISNYFVFSLAVSDLMVGCSIPYHMCFYLREDFGSSEIKCLLRFVLTAFACASSICNLLFIATDRYVAIVYPLHYNRFMTRKTAVILITLGWMTSFSMASVPILWNDWHEGVKCEVINVLPTNYLKFIVSPLFVIIWIMMLLLYARICREASGHAKRIKSSANLQSSLAIKESKSFQMMLLILGCFTFCWLPYFVVTLYARATQTQSATLYEAFFNLAVANSSMNPLIYAWKNKNFRKAFLCLVKCHRPNGLSSTNYVTNHIPSKKNSINGICNMACQQEDIVRSELDIEMHITKARCAQQNEDRQTEYSVMSDIGLEISNGNSSRTLE